MTDLERKIHTVNKQAEKGEISSDLRDITIEYLNLQEVYYNTQIKMADKFKKIVNPLIESAKSIEELESVKEYLRNMPDCADKVLIFHSILIKEKQLNN